MEGAQNIVVVGRRVHRPGDRRRRQQLGKRVTVVEALPRPMGRAVTVPVSGSYAQAHAAGARDCCSGPAGAHRRRRRPGDGVEAADGQQHPADLVVAGIGIVPNVDLAQAAGLAVAERDRRRSAACDRRPAHFGDRRLRALSRSGERRDDPARIGAERRRPGARGRAPHRGAAEDYAAVPWFWSDQGDLKLQMVGLTAAATRGAARRSGEPRVLGVLFPRRELIGIESVNRAGRPHVRPPSARRRSNDRARPGRRLGLRSQSAAGAVAAAGAGLIWCLWQASCR